MRCAEPKLTAVAVAALMTIGLTGCSSGDSTASKTPGPLAPAATKAPSSAPPVAAVPSGAASTDQCVVNLAAPAIAKAVSDLPHDSRSNQGWSPEPVAGNYNPCAPLSVVIVRVNTNAPNPATRAVMFHLGQFIPTGVPDTYGFNGIDDSASTGDTVALSYTNPATNLKSVVRFHWNGNGVELIGNAH